MLEKKIEKINRESLLKKILVSKNPLATTINIKHSEGAIKH